MTAGDLTTLTAVRSLIGETDATQTENDVELEVCIAASSRAIRVYTAQEFASLQTGSQTRVFQYYGGGRLALQPYTLQELDIVEVDTDGTDPATLVENSDFYLMPRGGNLDGVFESLEMHISAPARNASKRWREVAVTGEWGYNEVPADVARAAALLAVWWYRNQSTVPGQSLNGEGDRFGPVTWPTAVLQMLAPYRVIGFG